MYQNLTLEQIKLFLKQIKQDIVVTKISRNIVVGEFHLVGLAEIIKTINSLNVNSLSLSSEQYFWLKNPNSDVLAFITMIALGIAWSSYQVDLHNLYETEEELNLEQDKKVFIK